MAGSVTHRLIRVSTRPILIVPEFAGDAGRSAELAGVAA
jgi:hypothetical protein